MDSKTIRRALRGGLYLIALTVILFSASPALAQVDFTTDEAAFLARNPDLQFQDFLGKVLTMPEVCANPANSSSNDDCFTPGQILPDISFFAGPSGLPNALVLFNGNFFGNNNPPNVLAANIGGTGDSFDIIFTAPGINAVGLNAGCVQEGDECIIGTTVRVSVFGDSGLLGSIVIPVTSAFNSFLGISTVEPITEISMLDENDDAIQGVLNVWFGTRVNPRIPTLSEWGMIAAAAGLMLVGVFYAVKRRRLNV